MNVLVRNMYTSPPKPSFGIFVAEQVDDRDRLQWFVIGVGVVDARATGQGLIGS
jgi:hypothetical protein